MNESSAYSLVNRLAALYDLLRRGPCSKSEIFERLPLFYETGYAGNRRLGRDLTALRQFGHSVTYDRSQQVYTLVEKPRLSLTDTDVQTLALIRQSFELLPPLAGDVSVVLQKIGSALSKRQQSLFARQVPVAISLRPAVDYGPHFKTITLLEQAVEQGSKVRFIYPSLTNNLAETHVGVEPYEIQFFDRHFYLLGFSPFLSQVAEFRLDRVRDLELMPDRLAFKRKRPTIAFSYRLSERVARQGVSERFINQHLKPQRDGSIIVEAEGTSEFRIVQDLLRYGEQAEILGPPKLRARMQGVIEAMASRYVKGSDK
jgi:predicted DNA-binding transcriptional regulator YafY